MPTPSDRESTHGALTELMSTLDDVRSATEAVETVRTDVAGTVELSRQAVDGVQVALERLDDTRRGVERVTTDLPANLSAVRMDVQGVQQEVRGLRQQVEALRREAAAHAEAAAARAAATATLLRIGLALQAVLLLLGAWLVFR